MGIEVDALVNIANREKEQSMKSNSINPLNLFMQLVVTAHRTALAGRGHDKTWPQFMQSYFSHLSFLLSVVLY